MNSLKYILIVDDDPINNFLCRELIHGVVHDVPLKDFTSPEAALEYISTSFGNCGEQNSILLLLDINMPTMSGWEFMEQFKKFHPLLQLQFTISIVSSSVDPNDKLKADSNPLIQGFIEKPITIESIERLLNIF